MTDDRDVSLPGPGESGPGACGPLPAVRDQEHPIRGAHVVVIGGGVAGLSVAWRLLADPELGTGTPTAGADPLLPPPVIDAARRNLRVTVVEAHDRLGGNIRSDQDGGFLLEWGPNGFLDNAPETPRLCRLLGIENRVVPAHDAAARRFLFARGRLRPLPMSPPAFLASGILSLRGRLRVLKEPFVPGRPDPKESVFDFASRRIGEEAARILVDAMVSGVYGGDSRRLSLLSAFPKMHAMEQEHGGLVKALFARRRKARRERREAAGSPGEAAALRIDGERKRRAQAGPAGPGGVLTSFDAGMEVLIDSLAAALATRPACDVQISSPAAGVRPSPGSGGWTVILRDGSTLEADAVVLALPSREAAPIVEGVDANLATVLGAIPDAPLVVAALAHSLTDFPSPVDGFGFLVPRGQGIRSLGCLWDSSIYPNRAPEGRVLLRAMLGGAQDPDAIRLTDGEVLAQVRADLRRAMDLVAEPGTVWIFRHPHGIPQYTLGHPDRLAAISEVEKRWEGIYFTGNSYRGISVNHCVEESIPIARRVLHRILAPAPR